MSAAAAVVGREALGAASAVDGYGDLEYHTVPNTR